MGRSASVVLASIAILLVMPAAPAAAHGDAGVADEVVILAPGGLARFDAEVHYHRVVGVVSADGPVLVRLVGEDGEAFSIGPASTITLNRLVECCEGTTWAPFALLVENPSEDAPVTARVDAGLVHDDLAVTVYRAESGIVPSILLFGGIWIFALWRIVRRRPVARLRRAVVPFTALVGVILGLGALGAARYGEGGPAALVAAMRDVPILPVNPAVSRATLLLLVTMLVWGWAGIRWAEAGASSARLPWFLLGFVLIGSVVATFSLMVSTYDTVGIPLAWATVAVLPVLWVMLVLTPRTATSVPGVTATSGTNRQERAHPAS